MRKLLIIPIICVVGCAHQPRPTTRPSYATTQPSYWIAQPPSARVTSRNFDKLWKTAEETARQYGFALDREDYRAGVITTVPLTSKQFFEVWRNDVQTMEDLADSSLSTYRRTLRFQFQRNPDESYDITPIVIIERYAQAEHPITASVYLRTAFRRQRGARKQNIGTRETDVGIYLPHQYWYATGRDTVVEKDIARSMAHKLARS